MRPVRGGRHPASLARGRGASASSAAGSAASRRSCSVSKRALRAAAASASPGTLCTAKPDPLLHARIFRPQSSATKPTQSEQFLWTNAYLPMAKAGLFFARSANFSSTRLGREGHGMQCRVPELEESAIGLAPEDTGATRELKPRHAMSGLPHLLRLDRDEPAREPPTSHIGPIGGGFLAHEVCST